MNTQEIKTFLNSYPWYCGDKSYNLINLPDYKCKPDYPSLYNTYFGNLPHNLLEIKNKSFPRYNFLKFLDYMTSEKFVSLYTSIDSFKFISYDKKIIISFDMSSEILVEDDSDDSDDDDYFDQTKSVVDPLYINAYPTNENKEFILKFMEVLYKDFLIDLRNDESKFFMIAQKRSGLFTQRTTFKSIPIKDGRYDLFYGENFPHQKLKSFVDGETENLMLLHGDPGTGKSNFIKHIITSSKKKVIYIPPSMLEVISTPGFITFMMDNKNSILLIEDAEQVLSIDRNSATNNLLGLTDGFLKDALQLKVIATFNCNLGKIDPALLRKGRLFYEYKFDKLTVDECNKLSKFMELNILAKEPMTIAELFNVEENTTDTSFNDRRIGFV